MSNVVITISWKAACSCVLSMFYVYDSNLAGVISEEISWSPVRCGSSMFKICSRVVQKYETPQVESVIWDAQEAFFVRCLSYEVDDWKMIL